MPARTEEVFRVLKEAARKMRTVEYGDLAEEVGLAKPGVGMPLGYIRDELCRARGLPWLTALAVSRINGLPGGSFLPDGISLPKDDFPVWWRAMVLQVFATDWAEVELPPPADQ